MKKAKSQASAIRDFLIASEESGVSLTEIVAATGCCPVNASTLLNNWMKSGNVSRTGFRGSYRYYYTGKEFEFRSLVGKTRTPNATYYRMKQSVLSSRGAWFCSGDICRQSGVNTSVVCNFLSRLAKKGILEKRGDGRFEYRQVRHVRPLYFGKGKITSLVYEIFCFPGGKYSVDEVTYIVVAALADSPVLVRINKVRDSVRNVIDRWCQDGFLSVVSAEEDPPLFQVSIEVEKRPLCVA